MNPDSPAVFGALVNLLSGIDNHLPFDATPVWGKRQRGTSEKSPLREPRLAEPGHRLAMLGDNLANVYQTLRNDKGKAHWQDTLHVLRLGLGDDFEDVAVSAAGGGYITLAVEFRSIGQVPALQLADGILSYLAFVAMFRLDEGRTLLAFDEPETHLHPALLARVMTLFEDAASRYPVVVSTHSDRLLDSLAEHRAGQAAFCGPCPRRAIQSCSRPARASLRACESPTSSRSSTPTDSIACLDNRAIHRSPTNSRSFVRACPKRAVRACTCSIATPRRSSTPAPTVSPGRDRKRRTSSSATSCWASAARDHARASRDCVREKVPSFAAFVDAIAPLIQAALADPSTTPDA